MTTAEANREKKLNRKLAVKPMNKNPDPQS